MQLKLVSFNMKRTSLPRNRNDWNKRKGAISAFFQAEKPDVVGTQELLYEYILTAASLMPDYAWVGEGRKGGTQGEYTAIFYRKDRLKLLDWGVFWLSKTPGVPGSRSWLSMCPRTCTWALLESLEDGSRVQIYNTHLDCLSFAARLNGLRLISQHIERFADGMAEIALMGDFNAGPDSRPLMFLRGTGNDARVSMIDGNLIYEKEIGRTYHGFRGKISGRPIDYILTSGGMEVIGTYINRQRYLNRFPSDHYPVVRVVNTQSTP